MNCSKCGGKIVDGCCIKCGYMVNGNKIKSTSEDKNYELKIFNKNFDKICMNKNLLLIALLGPLYFSYMGHFFLGTILVIFDIVYFIASNMFTSILNMVFFNMLSVTLLKIFIVVFNRLLYIIFANKICLLLDKLKIKKIKKKYKENYIEKLENYKHHKYYLLLTVIIYLIALVAYVTIKRF